ncbi:MAG: phytanoyl-CoA dioxygenase [Rhodospirillaceae bacterium]|nr:MAG: phytanoyl-CoA dioxygenase [Rhodospirillaceae bacterium]
MLKQFQLTDRQIETFRRDGYVLVRGASGSEDMVRIDTWAREVENAPEESGRYWVYGEESRLEPGRRIICRIENIISHHPDFTAVSGILQTATSQLIGEPTVLFKDKINFKMPGGDGFKPHQDQQAG